MRKETKEEKNVRWKKKKSRSFVLLENKKIIGKQTIISACDKYGLSILSILHLYTNFKLNNYMAKDHFGYSNIPKYQIDHTSFGGNQFGHCNIQNINFVTSICFHYNGSDQVDIIWEEITCIPLE